MRRRWAASEAVALGWGGITDVSEATGLSPTTIRLGIAESRAPEADLNPQGLRIEFARKFRLFS